LANREYRVNLIIALVARRRSQHHMRTMPDPFPVPDDLDAILNDIWTRWGRGAADRRSPFHTPVVASISQSLAPEQRVMVLRKVDRPAGILRFHTDRRSTKTAQIGHNTLVSVIGYDASAKIQIRASGTASIVSSGDLADAAWAATSHSGRRSYLTTLAPGTQSDTATSGLPTTFEGAVPTPSESEAGRANFAIVPVMLDRLEWLHLAAKGHRRAAFTRSGETWSGEWLIP
jgi:pyridoxamine 5'-phosphate oxidase